MSDDAFEDDKRKIAAKIAAQQAVRDERTASERREQVELAAKEQGANFTDKLHAEASEADKEVMMQAIMPYVSLLTDMIQKQAERIDQLETQVKGLQQE